MLSINPNFAFPKFVNFRSLIDFLNNLDLVIWLIGKGNIISCKVADFKNYWIKILIRFVNFNQHLNQIGKNLKFKCLERFKVLDSII